MPDVCIDTVVRYTNQKYEQYCREHPRGSAARHLRGYRSFSKEEVLAFMGLSFISGAHKATKNPISDLYDSKFLPPFKAALSRDRLLLLIKFCQFDDVNARDDRKDDRFGHICKVWDTFNNCSKEFYGLGPHTTIDEMLQKFRGRCRFRQYMLSKTGRYGIKYLILADIENHHCYNAIPYLGKEGDTPSVNLGAQVVKNLLEPIKGTNAMLHVITILRALIYLKNCTTIILQLLALTCPIEDISLICYCQNKPEVVKLALVYSISRII